MSLRRAVMAPALPSPSTLSTPEILGSPFQLRKLLHRHSDPQFSDVDLYDAVDMGEHVAWANLDDPIYAEKDFEIYRAPQLRSALPVYYIKGWLPYSADTLFNVLTDLKYRVEWDSAAKQLYALERQPDAGSDVIYFATKMPWPFAHRDYIFQRRTKFFSKQNTFVTISQAAHHVNAPPEVNGVVRVETFAMRMSIRSTSTNSCDFYVEYEDDTNFSIPNYAINWMLSVHVPSFMNDLRKACANYASYTRSVGDAAAVSAPAFAARRRAEQRHERTGEHHIDSPSASRRGHSSLSFGEHSHSSSSSSSEIRLKRALPSQNDDRSEGDASSSSERVYKGRRLIHTPREKSKGKDRGKMKRPRSMNRFFSSSKRSNVPHAYVSPMVLEDFVVEFHKQRIGLHLEADLYSNQILVAHCEKNSEAASSASPLIEPGMIVTSVNGQAIGKIPPTEVLKNIKNAPRPLRLGFSLAPVDHVTPRSGRTKSPCNVLKCVFRRDELDFLKIFKPLDEDGQFGAVVKKAFYGKRESKKSANSVRSREHPSPSTPKSEDDVSIPEGSVLFEIDHCHVVNLAFDEIVHLVSRSGDAKVLSFKPGLAIVGDRDDPTRSALSKKLSMVFRWRSTSDDYVPLSPDTKATPASKSTSATDNSSVMSGDVISDGESSDAANSGFQSRSGPSMCVPDYSKVHITSRNIAWAWEQVHLLKTDERVFSAAMLIEKIEAYMMREHKLDGESAEVKTVFNKMHDEREWIDQIKERRTLGVKALYEFNNEEEAEWIFGQTYFGVSTHWKPGVDGTVWLKLDGLVEGVDVFNTIAVMREIDLFSCWVPFCNQSQLVHKDGHVDVLAYVSMIFPLLKRDAIIRAVGINACYESRCILLLGGSVEDSEIPSGVTVPRLKGWNADRLEMRAFRVLIEPITRTKARTCIVCNVDPKCAIPKTLLNFSIKKVAGILLFLLRKEAEKIEKAMQDGTTTEHVARLKSDPDHFYEWLRPLVDQWFADLQADRLPPPLKFPKPSELDLLHEMNRSTSTTSCYSRTPSEMTSLPDAETLGINGSQQKHTSRPQLRHRLSSNDSTSSHLSQGTSCHEPCTSKRTWVDYLYDFGIWPYFLLFIFSRVTADDHFLYVCALKFIFTSTCTWFGVPGAYSWQTRQLKRARRELHTLRRRCVLIAAVYDIVNSWIVSIWVNWLLCYAMLSPSTMTKCMERSPLEIRESENFWLMASAFTFASVVVGVQVVVNI